MNIADVIRFLAILSCVLMVGAIGVGVFLIAKHRKVFLAITVILVSLLLSFTLNVLSSGVVFVNQQERVVVVSAFYPLGVRPEPLAPGLHWVTPFFENTTFYSVAPQTYIISNSDNEPLSIRTADGQTVLVEVSVTYQIDPDRVVRVYFDWQHRYINDFVRPLVRGIVRNRVSNHTFAEVMSLQRTEIIKTIKEQLTERFSTNGFILLDFEITDISVTQPTP